MDPRRIICILNKAIPTPGALLRGVREDLLSSLRHHGLSMVITPVFRPH
jgi:hypothetical protein